LDTFGGGFHKEDVKFHDLMVFIGKSLLQSCIFHKNVFTEAYIHQKSAAHFTSGTEERHA